MCEAESRICALFEEALSEFLQSESENICLGTSERNLCGRLAIALNSHLGAYDFDRYYVDTEYNRKQDGQIKTILDEEMVVVTICCDVIIHTRGESVEDDNLLAIEMKKANRPQIDKENDRRRLRAMTKSSFDDIWSHDGTTHPEHVCGYTLGAYVELDKDTRRCTVEHYQKGHMISSESIDF